VTCPSCGNENRPEAKFCLSCGSALARTCPDGHPVPADARFCDECGAAVEGAAQVASAPASTAPAAERRLVSVLFADLVGHTSLSEGRDAEEVRELLSRYFENARTIIERYGGTVEKFIGDAVMAVWGTPIAQEDDAERAVRAALDLVGAVPDLDPGLQARAGVLTGEAAVTVGAEGQGMVAGDLVNTASRIQSAAEPGTVLAGETTRRASEAAIAYVEAGEHDLKGKAEPVSLWQALRVVANRGGEGRASALEAPFVGRDRELRLVKDLFHGSADDGRATLVTVVGVAGIGKSRLAWEFEKHLDGLVEQIWWHRGRCLAYGEGVAFWALAEMVRMRAGIAEDEPESSAVGKLAAAVEQHVSDHGEREWVEPLLRHLLGLGERPQVERADLFSAWRLFFERMSDSAPVALVFEDLHWADTALLDFVEHLLEWSRARPIFVLALTRPELLERRSDFGARSRSSTTLVLEPLSDDAMDALLDGLVPGLPDDVRSQIRERADGIPLYAVETVRMLLDRGALAREGDTLSVVGSLDSLDVPETLHALIAARLDGLEPEERRVIEHAAVLGKTFGVRGVAALGAADEESLAPVLERLVRKELLTIDADPRSPERGQYGFLQALVQRVAYETLARKERGRLHRAAAVYLERDAGIDPDEIAEVIAAHYRDAYETAPNADDAASIRRQALEWLRRAAERSAALAATEDARRAFDDAAALAGDDLERAELLERAGELAFASDDLDDAVERLERSRALYLEAGRAHDAARAAVPLSTTLWALGRVDDALDLAVPALDLLAADEPDEDVARLAAEVARLHFFRGELDAAMPRVEQALAIAESQRLPEVLSQALNTKSLLIRIGHPREARALIREALDVALEHDLVETALRAYNNLAVNEWDADRREESRRMVTEGFDLARHRGHRHYTVNFAAWEAAFRLIEGRWRDAFALADEFFPDQPSAHGMVAAMQAWLAYASLDSADPAEARRRLALVAPEVLETADIQLRSTALFHAVVTAIDQGRAQDALDACRGQIENELEYGDAQSAALALGRAVTVAQDYGLLSEIGELVSRLDDVPELQRTRGFVGELGRARGVIAAHTRDEEAAAEAFGGGLAAARSAGDRWLTAQLLTDYARALVSFGRVEDAAPLFDEAEELWEQMGAAAWLDRIAAARDHAKVTA